MWKLFLLLGALSSALVGQAQLPDYGQQLQAVHSVQSAQLFMRNLGGPFADLSLDSLLMDERERCAWYQLHSDTLAADEMDPCARYYMPPPVAWVQADFDADKQPDLFINAGWGEVYAVLNRGARPPEVVPVAGGRNSSNDCYAFELLSVAGRAAIRHVQVRGTTRRHQQRFETFSRQDTLVYQAGGFVEYNPQPDPQLPYRLGFRYRLGGPPRPDPGYDLLVNLRTGRVRSDARLGYGHVIGKYRYRLPASTLDTLRRQVAYVAISRLEADYAFPALDASSCYLTFYRRGRKAKAVKDYGGNGPYSLQRLYQLLYNAHELAVVQRWQRQARQPKSPPETEAHKKSPP